MDTIRKIVYFISPSLYSKISLFKLEVLDEYKAISSAHLKHCNLATYVLAYFVHGVSAQEYECLGFHRLNHRAKKEYVTMRRNRWLDRHFNNAESDKILWDKGLFNRHFAEFIHHKFVSVNSRTSDNQLKEFYNSLKEKQYIVKPNDSFYGKGVYVASSLDDLLQLRTYGKDYIVEELVKNDPDLAVLNESSLNTFRVVTCIDREGFAHVLRILLRTGCKGAVIDNMLGGGTCYHVDIESGIIDGKGRDVRGCYYLKHPTSGCVMPGFKVKSSSFT